jgi:hypothetical protein
MKSSLIVGFLLIIFGTLIAGNIIPLTTTMPYATLYFRVTNNGASVQGAVISIIDANGGIQTTNILTNATGWAGCAVFFPGHIIGVGNITYSFMVTVNLLYERTFGPYKVIPETSVTHTVDIGTDSSTTTPGGGGTGGIPQCRLEILTTEGLTIVPVPSIYSFTQGSSVTVTATITSGYTFSHWRLVSGPGSASSATDFETKTTNPLTILMDSDKSIIGVVNVVAPNGTITKKPTFFVSYGVAGPLYTTDYMRWVRVSGQLYVDDPSNYIPLTQNLVTLYINGAKYNDKMTDNTGYFEWEITFASDGIYSLRTIFAGNALYTGCYAEQQVTVDAPGEEGFDWTAELSKHDNQIIGVVIVIAGLALVLRRGVKQ